MASRDSRSNMSVVQTIKPDAHATGVTGAAVDTRGFESVTIVSNYGATVDAGATISIEASVDAAFTSPVALTPAAGPAEGEYLYGDAYLVGQADSVETFAFVAEQYRYVRAVSTIPGASDHSVSVILSKPHDCPAV